MRQQRWGEEFDVGYMPHIYAWVHLHHLQHLLVLGKMTLANFSEGQEVTNFDYIFTKILYYRRNYSATEMNMESLKWGTLPNFNGWQKHEIFQWRLRLVVGILACKRSLNIVIVCSR